MGNAKPDQWKVVLRQVCQEAWDETGRAVLLSRVPSLLRNEGIDLAGLLAGRRLRPFLQTEGADAFQLLQSEANPIVWGIVPAAAEIKLPVDQYLQRADSTPAKAQRFAPAVWKAFTTPVEPGFRRWLLDEPSPHFRDLPDGQTAEGGKEIQHHLIAGVPAGGEVDNARTLSAIARWSSEQRVDPSRLSMDRKRVRASKPEGASSSSGTQLDELLGLFLPAELTRVSVPLDVIARLSNTPPKNRE